MATRSSNLWENDPTLIEKDAQYQRNLNLSLFHNYRNRGIEPTDSQLERAPAKFRKEYSDWLKANPISAKP